MFWRVFETQGESYSFPFTCYGSIFISFVVVYMNEWKKKVIEVRTKAKTEPQIIFQETNPNFGYGIEN